MLGIECPRPTYDKICESGLIDKILEKQETVKDLLLYTYPDPTIINRIKFYFEKYFLNFKERLSDKTELYKSLFEACSELDKEDICPANSEELLFRFPEILAYAVLEENVLNFSVYGFNTRRQLEEGVTSFCISAREEMDSFYNSTYTWRTGNFKNSLSNSNHGDLSVLQIDVSGKKTLENTLFGRQEVFDTWKKDDYREGISAHYDAWEDFLIILLRYAETLGRSKDPDILGWKSVIKEVGVAGTCTAEAEFGGGDWSLREIKMELLLLTEGKEKLELNPLAIWQAGYSGESVNYYPYVSGKKLLFLTEGDKGEIKLPFKYPFAKGKIFRKVLEFEESDLPYLLRGTYRLFARDRSILPKIMDAFIQTIC